MESDIRFCRNSQGAKIAYATIGEGPLLVLAPDWISNLVLHQANPAFHAFLAALCKHHTILYYDKPGTGLSERERNDFSLQRDLEDLVTVVDAVSAEPHSLFGSSQGAALAIAYAAEHPGRVTELILYGGYSRGPELAPDKVRESLIALVRANWGLGRSVLAELIIPDQADDAAALNRLKNYQKESATKEMAARLLESVYEYDVSNQLASLQVPTLVLHRRNDRAIAPKCGIELAAEIPNARLVMLDGDVHLPYLGDAQSVLRAVREFLGDPDAAEAEVEAVPIVSESSRQDGLPEGAAKPRGEGKYQLVYRDLVEELGQVQKERCRIGLAQLGMPESAMEEGPPGLFSLREAHLGRVRDRVADMVRQAGDDEVDVLLFPEMAIDLNHVELLSDLLELAKACDMYIVPGTCHDLETRRNVCRVLGPEGILWEQHKHIPAIMRFGDRTVEEGIATDSARRVTVCNTKFGRMAIVICRDFLDLDLRVELKNFTPAIDIVLNPAMTPVTADFEAAHFESRRSIYAYCFFCNVAEFGNSSINTPEKDRTRRVLDPGKEDLIFKDVDLFNLRAERRKWEKRRTKPGFIQSTT